MGSAYPTRMHPFIFKAMRSACTVLPSHQHLPSIHTFTGDTAFALLLYVIVRTDTNPERATAIKLIKPQILGVFGHGEGSIMKILLMQFCTGVAHMFIGHAFEHVSVEWMSLAPYLRQATMLKGVLYCAFLCAFWFGFMWGFHPQKPTLAIFFSLGYGLFHFFCVPGLYAFTYVNCMLGFHFAVYNLLYSEKGEHYNAYVLFFAVPVSVVAWVEALACEQALQPIGGHLVYDLSIPVSMLAFYLYVRATKSRAKECKVA